MKRETLPDGTIIYAGNGGATAIVRLGPGIVLLSASGTMQMPAVEGPMQDFDDEMSKSGKLVLFLDLLNRNNVANSSREAWSNWAKKHRGRVSVHILVKSKLVDMAISVMAMVAGGIPIHSYSNVSAFEAAIARMVPGFTRLPPIPSRALSLAAETT